MQHQSSVGGKPDRERFEALQALYVNKQQWMRHYEALVAQITPVSTTASIGICAYLADSQASIRFPHLTLLIPAVIVGFSLWFTWWSDSEIRRGFSQIVSVEIGMGFYDIEVEGEFVLPDRYRTASRRMRPIIAAGYVAQAVSGLVLLGVGFFLLTQ
jgi:hypothetical protein